MKIAILTQPLKNNYGGNLQNFALQKVLRNMGHEPVTIDRHRSFSVREKLRLGYFKRLVLFLLGRGFMPSFKTYFASQKHQEYIREDISRFIDTHIVKTPRLYSDAQVQQVFKDNAFDAVIVGSDQCWRPKFSPNINTYFLDFLKDNQDIKKIAYAASFGTDEWEFTEEQTECCKQLVQQFDLVTVREKTAVNLVEEKFNKEAEFVLDPTLLLTKEDYIALFKDQNLPTNKGVYTYILDKSDWKKQVVDTVKAKLDLPHYSHQHDEKKPYEEKIPSIEGWIKGFADADFVITDSFHGTVFSIIFNKPFISLVNVERGASRFESILNELGLRERLLSCFNQEQVKKLLNNDITYPEGVMKIDSLKESTLELLNKSIRD